ncbi:MAG: discoidin domain-containing protein [Fimbriimonas sp.]
MPIRTMIPTVAAGTSWVALAGALAIGGGAAVFPGGVTPAQWLRLTAVSNRPIPSDHQIVGVVVTLIAEPSSMTLGRFGVGALLNWSQMTGDAPAVWDGDPDTGHGGSPNTAYTYIHDLGGPVTVSQIQTRYRLLSGVPTHPLYAYSDDGSTWTSLPPGDVLAGEIGGIYNDTRQLLPPVAARFWRISITDANPQVRNFRLYNGATSLTPLSSAVERLQVALTVDGTNPVGTLQTVTVGAGGTFSLGGPSSLLGTTLTPADANGDGFGILIRRADALGGETTATDRRIDLAQLTLYHSVVGGSLIMGDKPAALQTALLGPETVKGTAVAATIHPTSFNVSLQPAPEFLSVRVDGNLLDEDDILVRDGSTWDFDGTPDYNEMHLVLDSAVCKPNVVTLGTGAYRRVYPFNPFAQNDRQSYTIEKGDASGGLRATMAEVTEFGVEFTGDGMSLSGSGIARKSVPFAAGAMSAGANAVQTLAITGAGTFRLGLEGKETGDLTETVNAAALQTALRTALGASALTVTGTTPLTVTFANGYAGRNLPPLEFRKISGTVAVTVTRTTPGGYTERDKAPIERGHINLYLANDYASLAAGKLVRGFVSRWSVGGRAAAFHTLDRSNAKGHAGTVESATTWTFETTVMAEGSNMQIITDVQNANAMRFMRIEAEGPDIAASGFKYGLIAEMPCKISNFGELGEEQEVYAYRLTLSAKFDRSTGRAPRIELVSAVPAGS